MQLIDSETALERLAVALRGRQRFFMDTEFESSRRGQLLCLIQVSTGTETFLVDAIRLHDLQPLGAVLGAAGSEWVLHAASQDVPLLLSSLELKELPALFDTQVAWSLLSPEYSVSLSYLKYRLLGIRAQKPHQADDWQRRPLPQSQLEYAASDVDHLPALYAELERRADAQGRLPVILEASREPYLPVEEVSKTLSLSSFRNAWQLDEPSQAALRFLIDWYNGLSESTRAYAPEPKTLLNVASRVPRSETELSRIKGVSRGFTERYGRELVSGLKKQLAEARSADFVPIDPVPYATFDELLAEAWLGFARARLCQELEAAPEVLLPNRVLRQMSERVVETRDFRAATECLSGWRKTLVEAAYRDHCADAPALSAAADSGR